MPSTKRTTILARTVQCVAAAGLMTGVAFGASPIADATFNQAAYDKCAKEYETARCHSFLGDIGVLRGK